MKNILLCTLVVLGVSVFAALQYAADANRALSKLELQSEANTCRDVLKSDQGPLVADYCNGVIAKHDVMVKAYKEEQRRKLLERVRREG